LGLLIVLCFAVFVPNMASTEYRGGYASQRVDEYFPQWVESLRLIFAVGFTTLLLLLGRIVELDHQVSVLSQSSEEPDQRLTQFQGVRQDLKSQLFALSAMLVALVVVLDAARVFSSAATEAAAVGAQIDSEAETTPKEGVIAYGLYLALLLLLVYYPIHARLTSAGRKLVDFISPLRDPTPPTEPDASDPWKSAYDRRSLLEDFLELKLTPLSSLQTATALLAPLVSSLFGTVIPFG
jgi:hypothetical protein